MRFFMTSCAVLLTLVAFGPTQTLAKDPGGGQGKGPADGPRQSIGQPGTGSAAAGHQAGPNPGRTRDAATNAQPSIRQPGTGSAAAHREASPNPGRSRDAATSAQPSIRQQGTGKAGPHREASPNPGRNRDAGTSTRENPGRHVHPQFSGGAAATPDSWRYRSDNGRWWYWTPQNRWMWYGDNGRWMAYSGTADAYAVERPILVFPLPQASFSGGPITITNPAANGVTLSYTLDGTAYTIPPGYSQELREDRAWVIQFSRGESSGQVQYGLQSGLYTFTGTDQGWELYRSELPASR